MKHLLLFALTTAVGHAAPTPQGPTVELSRDRSEIVLNGMWRFQPAESATQTKPDAAHWGEITAPGTWTGHWQIPLPSENFVPGEGEAWKKFGGSTVAGWYERSFTIPDSWAKRNTLIQFVRLSTDALVWIDGNPVGVLSHSGGELDISKLVKPGKPAELRVFVVASKNEIKGFSFENSVPPDSSGDCASKGITGDIVLINRPAGTRVDHVSVFPSVRRKQLNLEVELADAGSLGSKEITIAGQIAEVSTGKAVKDFNTTTTLSSPTIIKATIPWTDAHLWDTHDPFLHRLTVTVTGEGIDDQYVVPQFGFREFWVDGKDLFMNGTIIRLRPAEVIAASNLTTIRAGLSRRSEEGHNILEIWPNDQFERGFAEFWSHYCTEASKTGMLMMVPPVRLNEFFGNPASYPQWMELARKSWRKYVNEPSVVIMVPTGNLQGLATDMDPRWIGRKDTPPMSKTQAEDWTRMDEANALLRAMDPTRPILHHQGGPRGDLAGTNMYLNWVSLQEREEWLSAWSDPKAEAVQPYCAVEFGTPLDASFFRNRNGFGNAYSSEAWMTEFCAIYLGPAAYEMETENYLQDLFPKDYMGKEPVAGAARWPLRQNPPSLVTAPAFQEVQKLFQRNTGRSWRTWGLSGGMVNWNGGFTHRPQEWGYIDFKIVPGDRGAPHRKVQKTQIASSIHDPAFQELPVSKVALSVLQPTLAWIAGKPKEWTEKGHHFRSGEKVEKSISIINDSRQNLDYQVLWELRQGATVIKSQNLAGNLSVGEIKLLPITTDLPEVTEKSDFTLQLTATIGEEQHSDTFALRAWPKVPESKTPATLYDPVGDTAKMLNRVADPLSTKPAALTIIGRTALSSGKVGEAQLTQLDAHVSAGNTLLIMAQDAEWMRNWWGLRVCRQVARRAWPVNVTHSMWQGIDAEDLRDWRGAGTLVEERPTYSTTTGSRPFIYHWGNQGSVSSAAVEKPHLSGWSPLLQCEFDLQYSPLMELRRGKGRVILCLLDLEDQAAIDPAAGAILARVLRLASTPAPPRVEGDGIAANDFPKRMGSIETLKPTLNILHSPSLESNGPSLETLIAPLKVIHQEAEEKPWLRFPRWRLTRVEHQIQANAGKAFPADGRIFHPRCDKLNLAGVWNYRPISRIWDQPGHVREDPGLNDVQRSLCQPEVDKEFFEETWLPDILMEYFDADAIIRRDIKIPAHWQSKPLDLDLGTMKTTAVVFFNGQNISGETPIEIGKPLKYRIAPEMVKPGKNSLAVRLWNASGPGGFENPGGVRLSISLPDAENLPEFYHPDYRNDFKDGDEPYRFFRW